MEKRGDLKCAWVNGNVKDLKRVILKQEFSKFGKVKKIFIDQNLSYAKVYLDNQESLERACRELTGYKSWEVTFKGNNYNKNQPNNTCDNTYKQQTSGEGNNFDSDRFSTSSNNLGEMDESCFYAGEYVDIHGQPVEVLQAENGQLFVSLDDVRNAGFNVYSKESFVNAIISKDIDLRHFENYLLNQGKQYILRFKQTFNEDEMLNVFERVRAKLQNSEPGTYFGEGRFIFNTQSKNFSITAGNNVSLSPASESNSCNNNRIPNQLPEDLQPSFGLSNANRSLSDYQNGRSLLNDSRKPQIQRSDHVLTDTKYGDNRSAVDTNNISNLRKQKTSNMKSKTVSDDNKTEEVWESKEEENVSIAAAAPKPKLQNDESSRSTGKNLLTIERVQLTPGSNYKVKVSHVTPEKRSLFYGNLCENINIIDEILLHVNTYDYKLPVVKKPVRNMLCVVYFEDCWYRAVVLRERSISGCALVELIDYGNREEIETPVREMSEEMKKIPGQGIRCTIDILKSGILYNFELKLGHDLEVFVIKHLPDEYDDLTHLVALRKIVEVGDVDDEAATPPSSKASSDVSKPSKSASFPVEKYFTEVPVSSAKIVPGETVIIVNYTECKLVLRNKETATICQNVYAHLRNMHKKPISNPKLGQLVLCSKDTDEGLHRAIITKVTDKAAELEFIDYYGGETLALKSLRNIDETLASYPSAKIEHNYPVLEKLTEQSDALLQELILQKKKVKATLVNDKIDFILTVGDKSILLSEKIKNLAQPLLVNPETVTPLALSLSTSKEKPLNEPAPSETLETASSKQEPPDAAPQVKDEEEYVDILYDDMPYVTAKLGLGDYSCYSCKGDSITLVSVSEENVIHLAELDISEPTDITPHTPNLLDLCLAKFEGTWYRALVTEIDGDTFEVLFVDYGNAENVKKADLRRFPKKLTTIPILGINAYFVGIPDTPKVQNRLKELIPDEEILKVDVKVFHSEEQRYGIEIPSVYETLREEGLI